MRNVGRTCLLEGNLVRTLLVPLTEIQSQSPGQLKGADFFIEYCNGFDLTLLYADERAFQNAFRPVIASLETPAIWLAESKNLCNQILKSRSTPNSGATTSKRESLDNAISFAGVIRGRVCGELSQELDHTTDDYECYCEYVPSLDVTFFETNAYKEIERIDKFFSSHICWFFTAANGINQVTPTDFEEGFCDLRRDDRENGPGPYDLKIRKTD